MKIIIGILIYEILMKETENENPVKAFNLN